MTACARRWCGHCQKLKGDYKKLAGALRGVDGVKVAAVDADAERSLGSKFGVKVRLIALPFT